MPLIKHTEDVIRTVLPDTGPLTPKRFEFKIIQNVENSGKTLWGMEYNEIQYFSIKVGPASQPAKLKWLLIDIKWYSTKEEAEQEMEMRKQNLN